MKKIPILFLVLVCSMSIPAQDFSIKMVELTPDQVVLHYDLVDTAKSRTYSVYVYSSLDNFMAPLTKITGDAGLEVKPGFNHKVTWNAKEELGLTFDGTVELEVRGRVYVPFIRLDGFENVKVRKRNTPFIVKWSGGTRQNILNFQLFKGEKLVFAFPNAPNESQFKITIPSSVRPGKDFYFKISDSKNREQVVVTSKFNIKRKIPLGLKAIPTIGAGALVYFLFGNKIDFLSGPPGVPQNKN